VRIGLGPIRLDGLSRSDLLAFAEAAGSSAFDSVWVAESRAAGVGGGLAAAALVAQHTPVRVGAAVDIGLYHPLYLAEDIAVADLASGGRLEVLLRPPADDASRRYGSGLDPASLSEHLTVLARALGGAHISYRGNALRVPASLDANQPAPERLAVNPAPAQAVVPIWVEVVDEATAAVAAGLGFGLAFQWSSELREPGAVGRWPALVACGPNVSAEELLLTASSGSPYFIVGAASPAEVAAIGRRLAGPLRMPDFPEWVTA
jgi:alkanesulfonate monooxygenase SsuD/methylene tetrahydromethanopterin reductase-like flavin-dependent oxidoreductase (luciferase family)